MAEAQDVHPRYDLVDCSGAKACNHVIASSGSAVWRPTFFGYFVAVGLNNNCLSVGWAHHRICNSSTLYSVYPNVPKMAPPDSDERAQMQQESVCSHWQRIGILSEKRELREDE